MKALKDTFICVILVGVVVGLLGCRENRTSSYERTGSVTYIDPIIYRDTETGCEYLAAAYERALTPRIASDGHTHMGCGGVQ